MILHAIHKLRAKHAESTSGLSPVWPMNWTTLRRGNGCGINISALNKNDSPRNCWRNSRATVWIFTVPTMIAWRPGPPIFGSLRIVRTSFYYGLSGLIAYSANMAQVVAARPTRSGMHWNGVLRHWFSGDNDCPPWSVLATKPL